MYLTDFEEEAFVRGKAAGLIPADLPMPKNEKEAKSLIFHIGVLFSMRIAYRNRQLKLRIMNLTAFTEEHLYNVAKNLPQIIPDKVLSVTSLYRENYHQDTLGDLYNYFAFGANIISEYDLNNRLPKNDISVEQIQKGFDIQYNPAPQTGLATPQQRATLAELICSKQLPTITRRQWCNLKKEEATQLISTVSWQMPPVECAMLDKILTEKERKIT